jgi:hypothetical protein
MPNRYEREIEEILRNLEQTKPKSGRGTKSGERPSKRAGVHMRQPHFSMRLSLSEQLLLTAIIAALIAGGYAYVTRQTDLFTFILVLIAVVCLILVGCSQFLFQPRRPPQSMRYGNITITPLRRNLWTILRTQWNLFKLRMRYRRKKEI